MPAYLGIFSCHFCLFDIEDYAVMLEQLNPNIMQWASFSFIGLPIQ